jgi:hypothetical protein
MTCEKHTELAERMAVVETEVRNNKKFIQDVRNDHEKTKAEITKIKVTVATYSCIGGLVSAVLVKVFAASIKLSLFKNIIHYCLSVIFPDSYAGN